jgi:hypothetical protein
MCVWQFNGSVSLVRALGTPHARLRLAYCSSDTNSDHLTIEKYPDRAKVIALFYTINK